MQTPAADTVRPLARIAVIGAGAWGTALAAVVRRAGVRATLWGRSDDICEAIRTRCENPAYLPGIPLPSGIAATTDLANAVDGADGVLLVTPSRSLRAVCGALAPLLAPQVPVVLCAKGIETGTGLLLHEAAAQELPDRPVGALSGPTFAHEVARDYPSAATLAFPFAKADRDHPARSIAARFAVSLGSAHFRPYISDDMVGVEIGGAVKNVVAIACGMMSGAGFAENTRAALITRGLVEMQALAEALGGRRETLAGLSGVGDLTLTCSSETSRNMSLGAQLGRGVARPACFDGRPVVVEGEVTAQSVIDLADRLGTELPICRAVHAVLHRGKALAPTFRDLMARPLKSETGTLDLNLRRG